MTLAPDPTSNDLPRSAAVVIVGGGFAGLATANALWRRGVSDLVILEQEAVPAFHSSGRNAAILRRLIEEPTTLALAASSYSRLDSLHEEDGSPILKKTGGLLIGDATFIDHLWTLASAEVSLAAERLDRAEVTAHVGALADANFDGGIFVPGDGVVDIHGLTRTLLAPVRRCFFPQTRVTGVEVERGQVTAVETSRGRVATEHLINASGFGANAVAALVGLSPLPFLPVRRHLFVTASTALVDRSAPWVWNGTAGYYFRPEGPGLLMCACDSTPWPDDHPMDPPVDPAAKEDLAKKFFDLVPRLADVRPTRGWAGLRVLTPDQRFIIGRDPRVAGFSWVSGLGGHGMTTACSVGELGADSALGVHTPEILSPSRFLSADGGVV
jgi:sarcosine oxidase subunit beta